MDWLKYRYTEVFTAKSLKEAREILDSQSIDLTLCDIEMTGENGLDLIAYIKERYPSIACIMVTCHDDFSYIQKALRYGVKDYLLKPVCEEDLYPLLEKIQNERQEQLEQFRCYKMISQISDQREKAANQEEQTAAQSKERISTVKEYIENHLQENIAINDIAKLIYVNPQYLMRIFKKETGQSITEYITKQRVLLASRMLRETDYTVNFISDCVGFESCSYFIRVFKKQAGCSPGEYRSQFQKKGGKNR